jgi:hypothetical protein
MPFFLSGNLTSTVFHKYSQHKRSGFPVGTCDTAAADGRRDSNVYEVKQWLWQSGRGKQRLGGLSVEKTDGRKEAALKERSLRRAETRRRRKADLAGWKVKFGCEAVQTCLYYVHTYIYIHKHVYTMYVPIYNFIHVYVLCTYKCVGTCTCIYHVHTCS